MGTVMYICNVYAGNYTGHMTRVASGQDKGLASIS